MKLYFSFFFLLIFFLATSSQIFAINDSPSQITSEKSSTLKAGQNVQFLFFEEIILTEGFQNFRDIKLNSIVFVFSKTHQIHFENKTRTAFYSSKRFQDKRGLIAQNIFPFHFFW